MTDLTVSQSFVDETADRARSASDELRLPVTVLSADSAVLQSSSVSKALHESSAERGLRAGLIAEQLEQLALAAKASVGAMDAIDRRIAKQAL